SKAEAGMMELERIPFTLDEVLANSFLAVQSQAASRKLLLLNEVAPGYSSELGKRLVGDPTRLRQVLSNLLSNAVKFTERGSVRVYSRLQAKSAQQLELRIEVHDTGSGLSKSQVERIFEKFAQADSSVSRQYGGTGLGLSIARELVILMGGEISVISTPGQGSCFWFSVPLEYSNDILVPPSTHAGSGGILLHQPGQVADSLVSVIKAMGLHVNLVSDLQHCMNLLQTSASDWIILQSDFFKPAEQLPNRLTALLARNTLRLVALDKDLLSADSSLRKLLPTQLAGRMTHLAHPVLAQDISQVLLGEIGSPDPGREAGMPDLRLDGRKILVLEDTPVNQELICFLLESAGVDVHLCSNGREAIELLDQDNAPDFDLVISDLEMPDVDGYEFAAWLREQTRWMDIPLIGLTGHAFPEVRNRCMDLGMDGFITKPVEAEILFKALADLLKAKAPTARFSSPSSSLVPVEELFMKHCSEWPGQLQELADKADHAAFRREVHSMVSIVALLGETELQKSLREFEQGLEQGMLTPAKVLNDILHVWPGLLQKYKLREPQVSP
ncbi:MAG TPA: ATP-binding protein, partial [Limnobacter sp.]|nr:ATP-binding protein [Limnobacter sp.]